MKTGHIKPVGRITTNVARDGRSIEEIMRNAIAQKEPIKGTAKLTYNDRRDGVLPQHDIRTDRWDIAQTQTDKVHKSEATKRHKKDFPEQYPAEKPLAVEGAEA